MLKLQNIIERIHGDRVLMALGCIVKRERVKVYLVGGTIRDLSLGRGRQDYDFVLHQGDITFVHKLSRELKGHLFSMGKDGKGRVYRILAGNDILDFNAMDGSTIGEDLEKRDFTINALAYSLHENQFYFHPGSEEDLDKKLIRMVSPEGFDRDPLRMIRGVRYLCILEGFRLEKKTKAVIRRKASLIRTIPVERIKMEMDRILLSPKSLLGVGKLVALGLLPEILPELQMPQGQRRMALFRMHAFSHYLQFLRWLGQWNREGGDLPLQAEERLILSYVALFTSMAKILAADYQRTEKKPIPHELPSHWAYQIMTRMKFSNRFKELVQKLMDDHTNLLKFSQSRGGQKALKLFIYQVATPVRLLITFSLLDQRASANGELSHEDQNLAQLCHRIKHLCKGGDIISPPTLITGNDVTRLGYEPGPVVGYILHCVREKQIRGEIGDREQALAFLRETFGKDNGSQAPPRTLNPLDFGVK
jgi:tRNA nucleotidyltransferase (CCA-adding enzyme)